MTISGTVPGYAEFEFDLPEALLAHLVRALDRITTAPLVESAVSAVPEHQGIYQLFLDGKLVYIGKTDAEAGLQRRLIRHAWKIQHRRGLDPERVTFRAMRVYVFTAIDLETQLIGYFGGLSAVPWNGSGFGANDPGRERDTTKYKDDHYDVMFPIDIDRDLGDAVFANSATTPETALSALIKLKRHLPYILRFEATIRNPDRTKDPRKNLPHPDLAHEFSVPQNARTARELLVAITRSLKPGWQLTGFPSHVILYCENREYAHGTVLVRS